MDGQFSRTVMLIGEDNLQKLRSSKVAVFGLGGVGGYAVEALARAGVGTFDLFDDDKIAVSNLNRQILATHSTVGMLKTEAAAQRIHSINPDAVVNTHSLFYSPQNSAQVTLADFDYVVDAIDTVSSKIELILKSIEASVPIISCMGTGNKLDPTLLKVCDIYKTTVCPLAKVMRHELKKRGVAKLSVVCSTELPIKPEPAQDCNFETDQTSQRGGKPKRSVPASISFVPGAAGLILASEVIKHIIKV